MKIISDEQINDFMRQLEKDYDPVTTDKPLLAMRDNREYWLFTEIWQRCKDFFDGLEDKK